ncbi:polysaccharide deacetylase family protein [Winogradskyella sp.]|uniref:polysaccharide deacetylase family protein n=1 Tax=Winogradskyella sp. TaxID=1883156 RepID=UPI0026123D83|nr:polysaccharide deacetylase family protein [Winogradskyella sp.]
MPTERKNILTIDCEDFLLLPAFKNLKSDIDLNQMIDNQINAILIELRNANDTKATFFIVGEIAKRNPDLVRRIRNNGHHLGSHSFKHSKAYKLTRSEFQSDLENSIKHITTASGEDVDCYRAPMWSYKPNMYWYWDVLSKKNIKYDSSIFPINRWMYGNPKAPRFTHVNQNIIELPPSTIKIFGFNLPFCGGIYFRFMPYRIIRYFIKRLKKKYNHPILMYFHPWELDPNLVRVQNIRTLYKFVLYHNTKNSMKKFRRLINEFEFTSINDYFINSSI